jgi:hypothetical protein
VYNSCSYREGFEEGWHTLQMLEGAIRLIFGFRAKNQPFSGATAPLASPRKHMFSHTPQMWHLPPDWGV